MNMAVPFRVASAAQGVGGDEARDARRLFVFDVVARAGEHFEAGVRQGVAVLLAANGRDDAVFAAPDEERRGTNRAEERRQVAAEHERLPGDAGGHLAAVVPELLDALVDLVAEGRAEGVAVAEAGLDVLDV